MTQPNEYFPTGASNYDSLADFAAKTEDDWAATNRGLEVARWGNVNTGARGGLAANLAFPIAIGRYIVQQLGLGVHNTLENIASALQTFAANAATAATNAANAVADIATLILQAGVNVIASVGNAISDALNGVKSTWNKMWGAVFGGTHTGKTDSDFATAATSLNSTATTASTNATTANTNIQGTWNDLYDGLNDGSGSTTRTSANVRERARGLFKTTRRKAKTGSNLVLDPVGTTSIFWSGQTNVTYTAAVKRR